MVSYEDEDKESEENEKVKRISATSFHGKSVADNFTSYAKLGAERLKAILDIAPMVFTKGCEKDKGLRLIYQNFSPYLYPFSVEYSILVGKFLVKGFVSVSSRFRYRIQVFEWKTAWEIQSYA